MTHMGVRTRVNEQGRVVIPAEYRRALGIGVDEPVVLTLEGASIRIQKSTEALAEVQRLVAPFAEGRKLVEELIAERRDESERE